MIRLCLAGLVLAFWAAPVLAQTASCGPRDMVLERLASQYGEARRAIGLGANRHMVEVFASEVSGTWTITMTSPAGLTCLVASGQAYESVAEVAAVEDEDA